MKSCPFWLSSSWFFFQVAQLLIQGLNLRLQVSSGQGQLIQHPAQAVDVSLHTLTQGQAFSYLKIKCKTV